MSAEGYIEIVDSIVDFCNGLEALAVNLRRQVEGFSSVVAERKWNPDKIKWRKAEGNRGPYERSEDANNLEFKAMLKDLQDHNGRLERGGWFYWVFKNGSIVGRKKLGKKQVGS